MHVTTYITRDNPNAVNKTLEEVQSFECRALKAVDEISPVLSFTKQDYEMKANYCYIDAFEAYYFINDKILEDGGIITLECSIDALYTQRNELLNCDCVVVRNEKIGINEIRDDKLPINPNENFVEKITFPGAKKGSLSFDGYFIGVL